jgi:hypothetical protein
MFIEFKFDDGTPTSHEKVREPTLLLLGYCILHYLYLVWLYPS